MEWVDSNPIPWNGHGLFFGWQPSHFFIPYPLWNPYGMSMEWCIPYGLHGLFHVDSMEFPMNFNCKSMYYSIRIPWTFHMEQSIWIPWNSPHGIPWETCFKWVVKNSVNMKNRTLTSATRHVRRRMSVLTVTLNDCYKIVNSRRLILL